MNELEKLGWNSRLQQAFLPYSTQKGRIPARVFAQKGNHFFLYTENGEMAARLSGRLRYQAETQADLPAVGDWVVAELRTTGPALISAVLPRLSRFSRKVPGRAHEEQIVAANIDWIFLLNPLDSPLNLRRLERFLTLAWDSGAAPVIILSKADLADPNIRYEEQVQGIAPGVPVYRVSIVSREGLDQIRSYAEPRKTIGLMGPSGSGKSSLVNALLGQEKQKVAEAGDHRKGRHTTTHRELIRLPQGGFILDTPGLRELQLWDVEFGLSATFEDIETLAAGCRFHNCRHLAEPDCAVRAAVEQGTLSAERLQSFHKLQEELKKLESRLSSLRKEKKKKTYYRVD